VGILKIASGLRSESLAKLAMNFTRLPPISGHFFASTFFRFYFFAMFLLFSIALTLQAFPYAQEKDINTFLIKFNLLIGSLLNDLLILKMCPSILLGVMSKNSMQDKKLKKVHGGAPLLGL